MKNNRIWIILIIVLVIVNIVTIGMLWKGHSAARHSDRHMAEHHQRRTEKVLKEKLNLSAEQMEQFKLERQRHFEQMRPLERQIRETKQSLFEMNSSNSSTENISPILRKLESLQSRADSLTYIHFSNLRSYCEEDQIESFNVLLRKMVRQGMNQEMKRQRMERQKNSRGKRESR